MDSQTDGVLVVATIPRHQREAVLDRRRGDDDVEDAAGDRAFPAEETQPDGRSAIGDGAADNDHPGAAHERP